MIYRLWYWGLSLFRRPPNKHSEKSRRAALHDARHGKILLATMAAFLFSAPATGIGLFNRAVEAGVASTEGMILTMMAAVVAAVLIGLATMMLFGLAVEAHKRQVWQLIALTVLLSPFTVGISTYNAILGTAGPASLADDMGENARAFKRYYAAGTSDASGAMSAAAALEPLQASICALAEGEKTKDVLSGYAGKGGVYAAYVSSCQSVSKIVGTLHETATRTESRREEAGHILTALQSIPRDSSRSVFERQAAFRAEAETLRKLLEASGAENVTKRLQAQLQIMNASVATLGVKDGAFGRRQAAAIENLKVGLASVGGIINPMLVRPDGLAIAPPPPLLTMGAAVLKYWDRNIPQILIAVASDMMFLWFLGLLMVSKNTIAPPGAKQKPREKSEPRKRPAEPDKALPTPAAKPDEQRAAPRRMAPLNLIRNVQPMKETDDER